LLTIASYNIHRCVGSDSIYRPGRIVAVIQELDADIIGLQEVDAHVMHHEGHQLDLIAKKTGYFIVVGTTMYQEDAEYGNAILSRVPFLSTRKHDLTVNGFEPRGALEAELEIHGQRLRLLNTHLGLRYRERRQQVERILEIVEDGNEVPLVLMGDFNEWIPGLGCLEKLRKRFVFQHKGNRTYPSYRPWLALDRVFVDPRRQLLKTEVLRNGLTRKASDHLPVKAYLEI
jgi:endonuclease/exonuclease/phosphatase family metal-dependent hydrolase